MITLHAIQAFAIALTILAAWLWCQASKEPTARLFVRFLLVAAVLFGVLPFFWGCISPTAPSCRKVWHDAIKEQQWVFVEGRPVLVTAWAPESEECIPIGKER